MNTLAYLIVLTDIIVLEWAGHRGLAASLTVAAALITLWVLCYPRGAGAHGVAGARREGGEVKVYGIWYADYSDSSCDSRVFSVREDAVAVCRATGGSLLEFNVDLPLKGKEVAMRAIHPGESVFWVALDGGKTEVREEEGSLPKDSDYLIVRTLRDGTHRLVLTTWATDEQHAAKIMSERRAKWIALGSKVGRPNQHGWRRAQPHP